MSGREYEKTVLAPGAMDAMEKALGEWSDYFASKKKNSIFTIQSYYKKVKCGKK